MKKYNNFDSHMILLGIIIPFLVFFISMNTTFAYFTASAAKKESSSQTATVKISFKTEGVSTVSASTESGATSIIPGDTLTINGTVTNAGSADAYVLIEYVLRIQKQGSSKIDTVVKKYLTFSGNTLVNMFDKNENLSDPATIISSTANQNSKVFDGAAELKQPFDGDVYDNTYKNAKVEYELNAYAIQTAHITQSEATEELLKNAGYYSSKVFGNSVQDGEPTPTNPSQIQSVGERTANLLNPKSNLNVFNDAYLGVDLSEVTEKNCLKITLKEGKTVPNGAYFGFVRRSTAGSISASWLIENGNINNKFGDGLTYSFTVENPSDSAPHMGIYCYPARQDVWDSVMDSFDVMYVQGNFTNATMPAYEPYGYKIPVEVSNKNLFNAKTISDSTKLLLGNSYAYSTRFTSDFIDCSNIDSVSINLAASFGWYDANKNIVDKEDKSATIFRNYIKPAGAVYLRLDFDKSIISPSEVMCVAGVYTEETMPDYVPHVEPFNIYLDEPLRRVGDVADYIDLETGSVVRRIKEVVLDSTNSWTKYTSVANHFQVKVGDNYYKLQENYVLSNYYQSPNKPGAYSSQEDYAVISVDGDRIRFKNKDCETVEDWVNWLNSLDQPLIVQYRLATPTTETIVAPGINMKNHSIVSVGTTIQPR